MKVITEMDLRDLYKKEPFDKFTLTCPERLTPAAYQFLNDRKIKIIEQRQDQGKKVHSSIEKKCNLENQPEPENGYLLMDSCSIVENKPEAYTHLKGKKLVPKNNERIILRGRIDALQANFINTILEVQNFGYKQLTEDLIIIFEYMKKIMRAEVLEEPLEFINFKGWSGDEIREYSHHPDKYFGVKHFTPDPKYGKAISLLNIIRTQIRELEVVAVDAFYDKDKKAMERQDIILAINRLSSLVYIIMCQYLGGLYKTC